MKLKPQREKEIETQILNVLKIKGLFFFKNNTTGIYDPVKKVFRKKMNKYAINGVSDILGCVDGRFVAIEVKSKNGKTTLDQKIFQNFINENGGLAFTTNNLKHCLDVLNEYLDLNL